MIEASTISVEGDVAKLKQIELQLRRMTSVFLEGADSIVIRDLEGRVLDVNNETERLFGWSRQEVLGKQTKHVLPSEWQQQADDVLARLQRGETVRNCESAVRTKKGDVVPVLVTSFLLTDDDGQPAAIAEIIKDVTELKKTTTLLECRNRELNCFTSTLSHDLAAPVRGIQSLAEDLQERCREFPDPEAHEDLRLILDSATRMQTLILDLLSFARLDGQPLTGQPVSCPAVLEQALANLRAEIKQSGAQVSSDPLPTISGNATQLTQLFQNLIGNAIKFCRLEAPRVHVSAAHIEAGWEFAIRDNGIGMDPADLEKIFKPFQRLYSQEVFPGTGIGLAICRTIVERHGGRIWVESEKGRGSVFRFLLPEAATPGSDEAGKDVPRNGA